MCADSRDDTALALERAERALAERDRRIMHLRALYDAARELASLDDPERILSTFLLMGMGPLGATVGFAVSMNADGSNALLAHRGLGEDEAAALGAELDGLAEGLLGDGCSLVAGRVEILGGVPEGLDALPGGLCSLVRWCGPGEQGGLLGMGRRVGACVDGAAEREFLSRLAGILVTSLRRALAEQAVRGLGRDLQAKNAEYEKAMQLALGAKAELDRRVFHLNTLYEATGELSGIVETRGILSAFLLTVMGAFSARQGGIYLHGAEPMLELRGVSGADEGAVARALGGFFEAEGARDPIPMSVRVLSGGKVLSGGAFPFEPRLAVAFAVDDATQGVLALGEALDGRTEGAEERDLLRALTSNALVFLKNSIFFGEITALNRDLTARNEELNTLLQEVSQCKLELSDVELARQKILEVVRRETTRSARVHRSDFVFMFLLSLLVGLVFNFSNPAGVRLVPEAWSRGEVEAVTALQARELARAGAVVVDARPAGFYRKAHVEDALNVPRSLFDFVYSMRLAELPTSTPVVVYGRTVSRHYDEEVAWLLKERGFTDVRLLEDGLGAWEQGGNPVRRTR